MTTSPVSSFSQLPIEEVKKIHNEIIYTTVRIKSEKGTGSGTILYSGLNDNGNFETFVLTANHVIDELCEVQNRWDPMLGRDVKMELRKKCEVDVFRWEKISDATGAIAIDADIIARDKLMDVALLRLRTGKEISPTASMFSEDIDGITISDKVIICGAAMGVPPIVTNGNVVLTNAEIDNYDYFLTTAPSIFGNSGGATFRRSRDTDIYELIGMPARITVSIVGFSASPITHLGYSVRVDNILKFLRHNCYNFIFDPTHTIEQDNELRKTKIEMEKRRREIKEGALYGGEDGEE